MNLELLHDGLFIDGMLLEKTRVANAINKAIDQADYDSQGDAAKDMGIANSTISRLKNIGRASTGERGKARLPGLGVLSNIKKHLGDGAYQAILNTAIDKAGGPKTKVQRSKAHHGTRSVSSKAARKAQE